MTPTPSKPHERKIIQEIEIDAPIEQVWAAISTAEGLTRWYPLEARVAPGVGGTMTVSWGEGMEATQRIAVWETNRHLQTFACAPGAPPPEIGALPAFEEWSEANPTGMGPSVLDIFLETRGGKTVLRLVHAGFLSGADWEEEYFDGLEQGWPFMLYGLRHSLRYHPGKPRQVSWPHRAVNVAPMEAWRRLAGADGLGLSLDSLRVGQRFYLKTTAGISLEGVIEYVAPPKLFAVIENMNNAFMGVMIEKCGGPCDAGLWLSAFDYPQPRVEEFHQRWMVVLERLFS